MLEREHKPSFVFKGMAGGCGLEPPGVVSASFAPFSDAVQKNLTRFFLLSSGLHISIQQSFVVATVVVVPQHSPEKKFSF
jgi:hypothetical protein